LEGYSEEQLLQLYSRIGQMLPGLKLKEVNLAHKLAVSLKQAEAMYAEGGDKLSGIPYNQRVQGQNSLATILLQLGKHQAKVYDSEQNKRMESALMKTLQGFPDIRDAFLQRYAEVAEAEFADEGIEA
jgi:hypothetical protein